MPDPGQRAKQLRQQTAAKNAAAASSSNSGQANEPIRAEHPPQHVTRHGKGKGRS